MNRFWQFSRSEVLGNLLSSILFALGHLPIAILVLNYTGKNIFSYSLLIFILGLADGFVFGRTKNIFGPTISHALWNWSAILIH